jgi:uncharacterized membrane protein YuzA (DUF378 family)
MNSWFAEFGLIGFIRFDVINQIMFRTRIETPLRQICQAELG